MLKRYHSFNIIEIEQLYSYELSIYIQLINEMVQAEKAEKEEQQRQNQF